MNRLRLLHPVAALALPLALAACGAGAPPDGQAPAPSPADTASLAACMAALMSCSLS